jgi:hypothetical protein
MHLYMFNEISQARKNRDFFTMNCGSDHRQATLHPDKRPRIAPEKWPVADQQKPKGTSYGDPFSTFPTFLFDFMGTKKHNG